MRSLRQIVDGVGRKRSLAQIVARVAWLRAADPWASWRSRRWYTGRFWEGKAVEWVKGSPQTPLSYLVAARGPADPQRSPRGTYGVTAWKQVKSRPASWWRPRIWKLLSDDQPRTFNAIVTELSNTTGEMAWGTPAEQALWDLVEAGEVAHTLPDPTDRHVAYFVRLYGPFGRYPWQRWTDADLAMLAQQWSGPGVRSLTLRQGAGYADRGIGTVIVDLDATASATKRVRRQLARWAKDQGYEVKAS